MPAVNRQKSFAAFEDAPPHGETVAPASPPAKAPLPITIGGNGSPSLAGKRVYLVDSYSLIYQVFHALPEMSGPSGQPVGAVHGFVRDMVEIIENKGADFLLAAFDAPGDNFRHELYPDYKVHREEMPADLQLQIPVIQRFMEALGIPVASVPGYEADDILATIARQVEAAGGECLLVTADKDCRQLITEKVKLYNIRKNEVFDAAKLMETWGIRPDQVVDFQALVGDPTDNVPGVPLIGPKNAQELLTKYGTLEEVLNHAHEISGAKRKENLMNGRQQALLSRQLVRLDPDVPLTVDWNVARVGRLRAEVLGELCREAGFRQLAVRISTLAKKFADSVQPSGAAAPVAVVGDSREEGCPAPEGGSATLQELQSEPAMPAPVDEAPWEATYCAVTSLEELSRLVAEMARQKQIVLDTETTCVLPRWAEIVGYSFCWKAGEAYYVPVMAPPGEPRLDAAAVRDMLRPVLENAAIEKVGQNIKYDAIVLRTVGVNLAGAAFDTMVADYLLDPGERSHNLDDLARRYLAHTNITIESLIGSGKNQKRMDEVLVEFIAPYAAEDADVPLRLREILEPRLEKLGLAPLFHDLEMPLIEVLSELEYNGVRVDQQRLKTMEGEFCERISAIEKEIYAEAGGEFNIDSRLQLGKLFFDDLKLPILKRTKTGPSLDAEVLEDLAKLHSLPAKILEYRHLAKLMSTYIVALQELIHPATGRVHTSFKQDVAATGRLSSQDPNLQNIPVRTEEGRKIRSAFLPAEGWELMTADYSQIELRVLAHFSGDETLKEAFAADRDIHTQVAAQVYSVPLEHVTKDMRRSAKAINFGIIYGQSPFGLAKSLDISKADAARFIEAYFAQYPGVDEFMRNTLVECRRTGYVSTIAGRRRPVQGIRDLATLKDPRQRTMPERIAINTVIQGSAADIIKRAMINVYRRLLREGLQSKMLLQIHDELVFEYPPEEKDRLAQLVMEEMAGAAALAVPLKIDVKTGQNWAECEPV
ncbi:MAG TPA: DNA polymerase I [Pirellulaceae bacterium]|nr:DNA polymerase I [Pirellulaceae bacterium]